MGLEMMIMNTNTNTIGGGALVTRKTLSTEYVVERDLFCDEVVRPGAVAVGHLRSGALVYRLTDVSPIRSKTGWAREACRPRVGEAPFGRRSANVGKLVHFDVWGDWQVEPPPPWSPSPYRRYWR